MTARTFRTDVDIATDDADIAEACRHVGARPEIPGFAPVRHAMRVVRHDGHYVIEEDQRDGREERCPDILMRTIRWRLARRILDEFPGAGVLSAASLTYGRKRILLAGGRRAGKSILALKLMRAGLTFEGDHQVFVRPGGVIAVPRPIHVARSALGYLPEIAAVLQDRMPMTIDGEVQTYGYDPTSTGQAWRIEEGPADLVFLLFANHGGASSIRRVGAMKLVQELTGNTRILREAVGRQLMELTALASGAEGFDLSHGDPDEAARLVLQMIDRHESCRAS